MRLEPRQASVLQSKRLFSYFPNSWTLPSGSREGKTSSRWQIIEKVYSRENYFEFEIAVNSRLLENVLSFDYHCCVVIFFSNSKFLFPLLIKFISFLNRYISEEGILKTYFLINYGSRLSSFVFLWKSCSH